MEIVNKSTSVLKPYGKNPRKNDAAVEYVKRSIENYGFKVPLVITKDNEVITGHTRLKAALKLGLESVPCIIADDLTDEQIKAFRLVDNKVSEFAEWDIDLLQDELKELKQLDIDVDNFNFKLDDYDFVIPEEEGDVVEDDGNIDIDTTKEPISKIGEIYQLGRHRLMCGDSTNTEDVNKLMNDEKADLLLTDPPYNVDYTGKTKDELKIENDKMDNSNFLQFLVDAFANADMVMKAGACFYIWHADSEGYNFRAACNEVGWTVRQCLIWNKNSLVMGRQDYQWKHEPCLYGWKDGAAHTWKSDRKQTTVIDFNRPSRNDIHPTMKPVGLFDYQIKNNTDKNQIVLDLFGGSGTTIMACEQNERTAYTMEFDPRYVDAIIQRWQTFTGEKAVLLNG